MPTMFGRPVNVSTPPKGRNPYLTFVTVTFLDTKTTERLPLAWVNLQLSKGR